MNRASVLLCFCTMLWNPQATTSDQALLNQVREKYDAPFNRNLQSFDCAVDFSWKEHFTETTRVGDEGTDDELENFSSQFGTASPSRDRMSPSPPDSLTTQ
jgi:hypothetical protein